MASRTSTALATLALAALSTAAVLTLGRVFQSGRFVLPVVGAVLLAHLLGFVARTRGWSLVDALSLSMTGLAAYLIWAQAPHTTLYGIPTVDTFRVLADRLGDGVHELRSAVVPAPATDGAILLSVLVGWVMAATADALAFWRRATIGAVAPALALFVWASTLGTDPLATRTTAGFFVAALLFLLVQHQSLVGRGRAAFSGRRVRAGTTVMTVGAIAGAVAVVGGLVLGPALPGADADPLIDVRGLGPKDRSYRVEPPLARIGEDFVGRGRVEVFTVRSPREDYWRVAALDRYESTNGGQWTLAARGEDEVQDGLHAPVDSSMLRQEFHITGLADRWLPAAYEPVQLEGGDNPLVVKASSTLVSNRSDVSDLTYSVSSRQPPETLTGAQIDGTNAPLPAEMRGYTRLPSDFPSDVRDTAAAITAGATNPYDRARALESFFLDPAQGFHYSLDVDLTSTLDTYGTPQAPELRRAEPERDQPIPAEPHRLLRSVREQLHGDGPRSRPSGTRRGRLHTGPLRQHLGRLPRDIRGRARLGRGLARRCRLDAFRAHARLRPSRRYPRSRAPDNPVVARDGRAADERVSRIRTDHGGLHPGAARHGAGRHQRAGDWPRQGRLHLRLEDRHGADRGGTGRRHGCRRHDRVREASASAPPSG